MKFAAIFFLALLLLPGCATDSDYNQASLEEVEDLAESLANDLLAMSIAIRDGDQKTVANHFRRGPSRGRQSLPKPPKRKPLARWIDERHWDVEHGESLTRSRDEYLANFANLTDRFVSMEDVRFKVSTSDLDIDGTRGTAAIKFFVVGRNNEGHRERIDGKAPRDGSTTGLEPLADQSLRTLQVCRRSKSRRSVRRGGAPRPVLRHVSRPSARVKNQGFVYHGVATADVNLDGLLDVATTGVSNNRLFLNSGDGTFSDVSHDSLIGFAPVGSGALFLDYDNDGDPDLFLAAVGLQILFENRFIPDGEVRFIDISEQSRVDRDAVGFSAVAADVNSDGFPDIYVASYNRYGTILPNSWIQATNGTPNLLLINQQDGTFSEEAEAWGVADGRWSYAAGFIDIDEDGDQDLYVTNDFGRNGMFRNDGDHFVDAAADMGVVDPGFGMGVSFGDYDKRRRLRPARHQHVFHGRQTDSQPALSGRSRDPREPGQAGRWQQPLSQ